MTITRDDILRMLDRLRIPYEWHEHPAIYTVAEGEALDLPHTDAIAKTLFLRDDKKRNHYLVSVPKDGNVNLKKLRAQLRSRRLSLAPANDLETMLGIAAGAGSPGGALNDGARKVTVVLDDSFASGPIGVPLNENTATVWLSGQNLARVLENHGSRVVWLKG